MGYDVRGIPIRRALLAKGGISSPGAVQSGSVFKITSIPKR